MRQKNGPFFKLVAIGSFWKKFVLGITDGISVALHWGNVASSAQLSFEKKPCIYRWNCTENLMGRDKDFPVHQISKIMTEIKAIFGVGCKVL